MWLYRKASDRGWIESVVFLRIYASDSGCYLIMTSSSGISSSSARILMTLGRQRFPWQGPIPGRQRFLTPSTVLAPAGLRMTSRISPSDICSQRQTGFP